VVLGRLQDMHKIKLASARRRIPDGQISDLASSLFEVRSLFLRQEFRFSAPEADLMLKPSSFGEFCSFVDD
jgi:hypothetical protein